MRRTALLTIALLTLAACGRDEAPAPAAPQPPFAPQAPAAPMPPQPAEARAAPRLLLVDASDAPVLTLFCRAPGMLVIQAPGFEPIASEDRLTIGAGDEAFAFVADLKAPGPGVTASGTAEADLFARMARGEPVTAVYGRQTVGPARAETPAALSDFLARCGGLSER
ncbi:MAG: hypothetical protein ACK4JY_13305 [Brevundimonas sp.]|uniref:hypothetical protein n=1 Tax=Brevundimonas sp. TaxID=1871086 RepID=UPI003918C2C6